MVSAASSSLSNKPERFDRRVAEPKSSPLTSLIPSAQVEYHPPTTSIPSSGSNKQTSLPPPVEDSDDSDDSSDDEAAVAMRKEKKATKSIIGPALAHLGFYSASIKPGKGHAWVGAGDSPFSVPRRKLKADGPLSISFLPRRVV